MSAFAELAGLELGPTGWLEVSQERIERFAVATDDSQWIHVDAERAARGPFGTTIAHGFLTLSLCVPMLSEVLPRSSGMVVNYGVNRVRFPGSRCLRADACVAASVSSRSKGRRAGSG